MTKIKIHNIQFITLISDVIEKLLGEFLEKSDALCIHFKVLQT
ncbi:hypothetical protein T190115A13A_40173 [Tenacibaculum sp. 190524A02b]|uniref:Transposase n=1 Tax=Tenacibaculum vairaonense TaxID=3137860 RepID=A0ABP1FB99_9FLAO